MTWPIIVRFPPWPKTTTLLALGFLAGCLLFTPMIAVVGRFIQPDFRDAVMTMAGLFKDGMLLILGYYFAKVSRDDPPARAPLDPLRFAPAEEPAAEPQSPQSGD